MISKLAIPRPARGIVAKFLAAANISDPTIRNAVEVFYNTLESANLISKFDAIYLFVGGNANAHKLNLLDSRDLNNAFRLTFSGGWIHDANGITGNAINTFANTWYDDSIYAIDNNHHLSVYNRTDNHLQYCDIGNYDGSLKSSNIFIRVPISTGNRTYFRNQSTGASFSSDLDARGWRCSNRVSSLEIRGSINSTLTIQPELFVGKTTGRPYYIGALNLGIPSFQSNRNYSFASIGKGFSDAELIIVYNAVQQLQIDLGRNV